MQKKLQPPPSKSVQFVLSASNLHILAFHHFPSHLFLPKPHKHDVNGVYSFFVLDFLAKTEDTLISVANRSCKVARPLAPTLLALTTKLIAIQWGLLSGELRQFCHPTPPTVESTLLPSKPQKLAHQCQLKIRGA